MNILFVNNIPFNPVAGGIERVTDILAKELSRRGHKIFYLCGKVNSENSGLLNYDFPAKLFQLPENGLFDNNANCFFYRQLQKEQHIDIVINQRGLIGWFNGMLPFTTAKLISVIHSDPESSIKQLLYSLADLTSYPFLKIKKFIKTLFPFAFTTYWRRKIKLELKTKYDELARYSDLIVTLSNVDTKIMGKYVSVNYTNKIHSISNPNSFEISTNPITINKGNTLLYIGRLEKRQKAPIRLLKIWSNLNSKFPDWKLKIVGNGPEKIMMEKYVQNHHLTNVSFEGQQKNVVSYYKEASFVCLTSNFEGWGMALTEGMQYGCIPFTFNNYGAASDIIDNNINGCLIKPFDLKQYAARLAELMEDKSKREMIAKASYEKVEEFSPKNIVDKWEHLFAEL